MTLREQANGLLRLYTAFMALYPAGFRLEFGDEMRAVFASSLEEAAPDGPGAMLQVCLRELRDLPRRALAEHWYAFCEKGGVKKMRAWMDTASEPDSTVSQPASWGETLLGIAPFMAVMLFQLLTYAAEVTRAAWLGYFIMLVGGLALLGGVALLVLGFRKGFPRWSMPYVAWFILFLAFLPAFRISPTTMVPGIIVVILLAAVVLVISFTSSWERLNDLFSNLRRDFSLLSFGLYGLLSVAPLFLMDEVDHSFAVPFGLAGNLVLAAGGAFYLRARSPWVRGLSLLLAAAVVVLVSTAANTYFWAAAGGESGNYLLALAMSSILVAILIAPTALSLLLRAIRRKTG